MPRPFSGGCACGAIRYECSADPTMSLNCHCRDCQRVSGSGSTSALVVPAAAFKLTKGEPKYHAVKAESGNMKHYGFCPECGSPLPGTIREKPNIVIIPAASLDDPSWHKPTAVFWTSSAQPWDYPNPTLQQFATEPPVGENPSTS